MNAEKAQAANDLALETASALMTARGLVLSIDRVRLADDDGIVPAPGVEAQLLAMERSVAEVADQSDLAQMLYVDPDPTEEVKAKIDRAVERCNASAASAMKCLRAIAQIGLGVSSMLGASDEVELFDRSLVGVLYPPSAPEATVGIIEDRIEFVGRTETELRVELGGAIARMLCDRNVELIVDAVNISTGIDGVLKLKVRNEVRTWDSPVNIAEPSRDAYEILRSGVESNDELFHKFDRARVLRLGGLRTLTVVPEGQTPSNDDWNEDWIKMESWDLGVQSLAELLSFLGVEHQERRIQQVAVERFVQLPAWAPAPAALKRQVASFLDS